MAKALTGVELLDEIKPAIPPRRFLQNWDEDNRILRFGCGGSERAVIVGSDGSVEGTEPATPTKLQTATVREFLDGQHPASAFNAIRDVFREYVYLADERVYTLIAAWIAGTYFYSVFSHCGYLFLHSLTPRCGKTRAEEIASHLAFEATTPRNAPTPPSMRETVVAGGTAIFDTLERWGAKDSFAAAMELLDAGFRKNGEVSKCVRDGDDWRNEVYPVYAPYMFAAINKESLTDTARDRSFEIAMARKSTHLKTTPYDARCEAKCKPLRDQMYVYALSKANKIADTYNSAELQARVDALGLHDRASDIWKPVLAVSLVMAEERTAELCLLAKEMSPDPDRQEEERHLRIVAALRTVVGEGGELTATTQQLIDHVRGISNVEIADLHNVLSGWSLVERSARLAGFDTPRKAWTLTDAGLAAVEARLHNRPVPA